VKSLLQADNRYGKKYYFDHLEIGESMFVAGRASNIATAASTWGTRYGIWLRVKRVEDGAVVTRLDGPIRRRAVETPDRKQLRSVEDSLDELKDAIRALTMLVLQLKTQIEEGR